MQKRVLRILIAITALLFLALTILAAVNAHRIVSLDIPVSGLATALSVALPLLQTVIGARLFFAATFDITTAIDPLYLLSIFDAILIALAAHTTSTDSLSCALETTWLRWFRQKTANIQQLQNSLACCGLRSTHDRAFPFPDASHGAGACVEAYGRRNSCFPGWLREARQALGVFIAIGVIGLLFKLTVIVVILVRFGTVRVAENSDGAGNGRPHDGERQRALGHAVVEDDRRIDAEGTETAMGQRTD